MKRIFYTQMTRKPYEQIVGELTWDEINEYRRDGYRVILQTLLGE